MIAAPKSGPHQFNEEFFRGPNLKRVPFALLAFVAATWGTQIRAEESARDAGTNVDIFDVSLEDMLNRPIEISTKTASTLDEAPGTVAIIDRAAIEASGARTLGELIRMVPGCDSSRVSISNGDPVDTFFARGVRSDMSQTTLILLNGRNKFNDLVFASPGLSHRISASMIERIEVIRGPGSALYGGSAFAGVINVVTRDAAGTDTLDATALYGQGNQVNAHALGRAKVRGWTVAGQATFLYDEGKSYESLRYDLSYPPSRGGGFELAQHEKITDGIRPSLDVSVNVASPDNIARAQVWYTNHNPHPFLVDLYPTPALRKYQYQVSQLMVNADVNPTPHLSIGAHYSLMSREVRGLISPAQGPPAINIRLDPTAAYGDEDIFGTFQRSDQLQLDVNYKQKLGSHSLLLGGSGSRENQWDSRTTFWGRHWDPALEAREVTSTDPLEGLVAYAPHVRYSGAIFLQDEWQVLNALTITGGVRYDRYDDVADALIFSPRIAVVWAPLKNHIFKAMYGQGFRPPSTFEQQGIISGSSTGNPLIRPERIYTGEVAYITYFESLRLQISGYLSRVVDNIVSVEDGDPNKPNRYGNAGQVFIKGAEIEIQGRNFWVNYSVIDSQTSTADGSVRVTQFLANQMLNAGFNVELLPKLGWASQLYLRGPRLTATNAVTEIQVSLDTRLVYRLGPVEIFGGITNLLDQQYRFPINDGGRYPVPSRGREFQIGVAYKLK